MNIDPMAAFGAARHAKSRRLRLAAALAAAVAAAAALAPHAPQAAPAASQSPGVRFEPVPGGAGVVRVILTAKAAARLGIETAAVGQEAVVRKQMVGGLIIPPMDKQQQQQQARPPGSEFGGFARPAAAAAQPRPGAAPAPVASPAAQPAGAGAAVTPAAAPASAPAGGPVWVLVTLSPGEWERLAKDKPVRLQQLATREQSRREVLAQPSGMAPLEDIKRSMLSVYYTVPGIDHGLAVNNRVRVELPLAGSEEKQKVVPYGAVYYDAKGAPWVYVITRPLTFERRRVGVERVVGDQAILADGPPAGTPVVSVGAALLYGAEIFKK